MCCFLNTSFGALENLGMSSMATSIKDVAKAAGVSTATVSHVINGTRFVSEKAKKKVLAAMKELDYRPNSVARSLRSQKSNIIGLLIPVMRSDTSNFFFMSVAQGVSDVLKRHGYNLILSNSHERLDDEKEQIKVFNSQLIDGLILAPTAEEHGYLHETLSGTYPVVFIDRKPKGYQGDCILADGFQGTYDAISMLIDKGHRKIGFITGTLGITTSDERLEGYMAALTDRGLPLDNLLIKEGQASFESGYVLAREIVETNDVSALFVANNIMTIGALRYLQETGIKIPEQIAIIGFDDYEWARITTPPLTVIKQPAYELGAKAAEVLLQRIANPDSDFRELRLPTELVIRSSC